MTESEAIKAGYKYIEGYEGHYMIDTHGNVFSLKRQKTMIPCKSSNGYMQVHLTKDGITKSHKIHRLVAQSFIPNPNNLPQVNHIDENKSNNTAWNLEWCTQTYNLNYNDGQKRRARSRDYEDISKKRSCAQSKEVAQCDLDGRVVAIWENAYVAELHGYNRTMINQCCLGKKKSHKGYTWKYTNYIEKQIAKKPNYVQYDANPKIGNWHCPTCNSIVFENSNRIVCLDCLQKLDWE